MQHMSEKLILLKYFTLKVTFKRETALGNFVFIVYIIGMNFCVCPELQTIEQTVCHSHVYSIPIQRPAPSRVLKPVEQS